ncbi:phage tail protein [Citrobacter freundii]|uniref:phage tail protein n=1 Tax=Citrobacter freundii TaxID=546 RepID=UPI002984FCA6|nr:phage tail protein [Citrobacter freundii]HEG1869672.1 phage tail protein [Citrobacter freundii]
MAINNFKPFALDPNANVTSQADWEALPALLSGFTAGKASSAQVNKAIRQASFIAAALAQYTANKSGLDVLDDGDLNGFISKMGTAFGKDFQALDATLSALAGLATGANKLPYFTGNDTAAQTDLTSVGRDIIGKNTIADILTYLGLSKVMIGDWGYRMGFIADIKEQPYINHQASGENIILATAASVASGAPAIGIPFFWPSAAMPNTVIDEWSGMVFLKFNNATFSAATYPKLALIFPALKLPEARGEFIRINDDGRGVDAGRALLSAQGDAMPNITGSLTGAAALESSSASGLVSQTQSSNPKRIATGISSDEMRIVDLQFSIANSGAATANENRPRNIAFNFLVRAK